MQHMNQKSFQSKLQKLFIGKTPLKKRLALALVSSFSLSFTLFLFGPLDLTYNGKNFINCTILELTPFCIPFWFITFAALAIPTCLVGGKIHSFLVSTYCGLSLGLYIQGNFLNNDLGTLNGELVPWHNFGDNVIINYIIWFLILIIPFLFHYFSRKTWKNFVLIVTCTLSIMQMSSLSIKMFSQFETDHDKTISRNNKFGLYLGEQYVLSPKENIIVFLLDQTSGDEMQRAINDFPNTLDPFHDFTCFDNMNSNYVGTFPALAHLLTMKDYDYANEGFNDFFKNAWNSETANSFYDSLQQKGWKINFYIDSNYGAGNIQNMKGKITNAIENTTDNYVINKESFRKLIKLSLYRYLPIGMKAPFWVTTTDISSLLIYDENFMIFDSNKSVDYFHEHGIKLSGEEKLFSLYHYKGAHPPYVLTSTGQRAAGWTNIREQVSGYMFVISEIINQMKELNIYDSSTIIITADHGNYPPPANPQSIFYIKRPGETHTEIQYSHAMISQENFLPTIASAAGLDSSIYGKTVLEISENQQIERCATFWKEDPNYPLQPGHKYNAMEKCCYTGNVDALLENYNSNKCEAHPLFDYFY